MSRLVLFIAVLCASPVALALGQEKHHQLTVDACLDAGFEAPTCREIGVSAHNTDAYEWEDLAAHAQIPDGHSTCEGVNASLDRMAALGGAVRDSLVAQSSPATADSEVIAAAQRALYDLGRVLHTVQDNCAHHGMPNPQHAWFSVSDMCDGTALSPDIQDPAVACAKEQTALVFARLRVVLEELGIRPSHLYQGDPLNRPPKLWPTRGGLCAFVLSPSDWKGEDEGWDNTWVQPTLVDTFTRALAGDAVAPPDACALPPETLALKEVAERVDTKGGLSCDAVVALCSGDPDKRDEVPPWENELAAIFSSACSVAPGLPLFAAAAWVIAAVVRRRRRR